MRILVGSTIPTFKVIDDSEWWYWLQNAEAITETSAVAGIDVEWIAVLQHDARGREPFDRVLDALGELNSAGIATQARWFSMDIGEDEINGGSRLIAICTGRNLIVDHALRRGHDAIYFADADIEAPNDVLVRLTELDYPVVGAHVPTYCLDGPPVVGHRAQPDAPFSRFPSGSDVRQHWNTAGSLLIARDAFRRVPWRWDPDAGETDDPATQSELERLGWPTFVRHDVICTHHPESIGPVEHRGHDLTVYR